ncbi:MAG: DedA family protein [Chloroflexi bacterium]|nr:DedA family protein [Chloroflexota bacterium]
MEERILDFIRNVYVHISWPGVVLMMAIESANIPLPSEIIMPLSGWMLIRDRGLSVAYVLLAGFYGGLGCTIGSAVSYWIGALGGRPVIERYGRWVLISRRDLDSADRWFAKYGDRVVFFSRLLPVIRTFISFPAGIARVPFWRFCLLTFIGSFVWSLGLAYGGYLLGANWEKLREAMRPFDVPIVIVVVILVGLYVYRHIRHLREESVKVGSMPELSEEP